MTHRSLIVRIIFFSKSKPFVRVCPNAYPLPLFGQIQQTTSWNLLIFFSNETWFDISCKLDPILKLETICMKCLIQFFFFVFFWLKNQKKKFNLSFAENFTQHAKCWSSAKRLSKKVHLRCRRQSLVFFCGEFRTKYVQKRPLFKQWRAISDCADAQSDQGLHCLFGSNQPPPPPPTAHSRFCKRTAKALINFRD